MVTHPYFGHDAVFLFHEQFAPVLVEFPNR